MKYRDLYTFPAEHPPSPYDWPAVIEVPGGDVAFGWLPEGCELQAVGWLDHSEPHPKGSVPDACIDALFEARQTGKVICDGTKGASFCEVCQAKRPTVRWRGREVQLAGYGHHLVRLDDTVYMCPELTLHYIVDHEYQPPAAFVRAVIQGRFLKDSDLVPVPLPERK